MFGENSVVRNFKIIQFICLDLSQVTKFYYCSLQFCCYFFPLSLWTNTFILLHFLLRSIKYLTHCLLLVANIAVLHPECGGLHIPSFHPRAQYSFLANLHHPFTIRHNSADNPTRLVEYLRLANRRNLLRCLGSRTVCVPFLSSFLLPLRRDGLRCPRGQ